MGSTESKKTTIHFKYGGFLLYGGELMAQIKSVAARDDYRLEVVLENGSSIILNLANRLNTVRFGLLEDKGFFCRATTDGTCIRWDNKIEVSASEVFQLAQKT